MRLIVDPIYTYCEGDFIEMGLLQELLVAPEDEGGEQVRSLVEDNRFYTGLLTRAEEVLQSREMDYDLVWEYDPDFRTPDQAAIPDDYLPGIELRPHQMAAPMKLITRGGRGVVNVATGGGKTEIGCVTAKYYNEPSIWLNDRVKHAVQGARRFEKYGIDCGIFGGGHKDLDHMVVSCVADSIYTGLRNGDREVFELLQRTKLLQIDECHHLQSRMWTAIAQNCLAARRAGYSASVFENNDERCYDDMMLIGLTGEVVCYVPPRWLIDRKYLAEPLIHFTPINTPRPPGWDWMSVYKDGIVNNTVRNYLVAGYAEVLRNMGRKVLVLVQRIDHGKHLLNLLKDPNVIFSYGGDQMFQWKDGHLEEFSLPPDDFLELFDKQSSGILVGSTVYDESVDLPSLTDLIMAGGGKKFRRTLQRIGRAAHSDNDFVHVFDFWDFQHPYLQKHSRARLDTYAKLEYKAYQDLRQFNHVTGINLDPQRVVMDMARRHGMGTAVVV